MVRRSNFIRAGMIYLLSTILTSCFPVKPVPANVAGLWVEREETDGGGGRSATCGFFRFSPDGAFEAQNIPFKHFTLSVRSGRGDASGTWQLDSSSSDPFALHKIVLRFRPTPGTPWYPRGLERSVVFPVGSRDVFWTSSESPRAIFVKVNNGKGECW